jgi:hypothetical protein
MDPGVGLVAQQEADAPEGMTEAPKPCGEGEALVHRADGIVPAFEGGG